MLELTGNVRLSQEKSSSLIMSPCDMDETSWRTGTKVNLDWENDIEMNTCMHDYNAAVNNMPHLPQLGVYSVLGRGCDIKI